MQREDEERTVRDYAIELEIFEGSGGQLRTDGAAPDFAKAGVCAWMYGRYRKGQTFRYPDDRFRPERTGRTVRRAE